MGAGAPLSVGGQTGCVSHWMGKRSPLAAQRAETEVRSKAVSLPASLRLRGAGIKAINGVSSEAEAPGVETVLIATQSAVASAPLAPGAAVFPANAGIATGFAFTAHLAAACRHIRVDDIQQRMSRGQQVLDDGWVDLDVWRLLGLFVGKESRGGEYENE